jgi:hypothetical protein
VAVQRVKVLQHPEIIRYLAGVSTKLLRRAHAERGRIETPRSDPSGLVEVTPYFPVSVLVSVDLASDRGIGLSIR